jgi:hypothetical protein
VAFSEFPGSNISWRRHRVQDEPDKYSGVLEGPYPEIEGEPSKSWQLAAANLVKAFSDGIEAREEAKKEYAETLVAGEDSDCRSVSLW